MRFEAFYKTLDKNKLYVFSYADILSFFPRKNKAEFKKMFFRWRKKGWIQRLKRGLYELTYPRDFVIPDVYIANKLYSPSYISLETALSDYSIIPQVSMAVTSITTKPTRRFKNKHGLFIYRTVKPAAFGGYYIERQKDFDIFLAEPEKAFVDYLYFENYPGNKKANIKDKRMDREALKRLSKKKLDKYAAVYGLDLKEVYAYL